MREHYLRAFDQVWIDCLNGDKYKTGKQTPDGKPDPSVFSTEHNREGIQVGTAVALLVRKAEHQGPADGAFPPPVGADEAGGPAGERGGDRAGDVRGGDAGTGAGVAVPADWQRSTDTSAWPLLPGLFPRVLSRRQDGPR